MKILKYILTGTLLFAVTVCMLGQSANAALIYSPKAEAKLTGAINQKVKAGGNAKNVKAKQAYVKELRKLHDGEYGDGSYWEFALIDLNKDGITEMVVTPDGQYHRQIWGYVNGKVETVGWGFAEDGKYYPNKKLYYCESWHGSVYMTYYRFNGKKMVELAQIEGEDIVEETFTYYIGKKKVSKNKWKKYEKQLKKGAKEEKVKYHRNIPLIGKSTCNNFTIFIYCFSQQSFCLCQNL